MSNSESGTASKLPGKIRYSIQYGFLLSVLGFGVINAVQANYLQYYMTNVAMLSTVTAAMVVTAGSIGDLISVPVAGWLMEKIRLPWGKYTSWLYVAPALAAIAWFFMFFAFPVDEAVLGIIITVFYILGFLFSNITNTATNVNASLASSTDSKERAILAAKKGQGSALNGFVFGFVGIPVITFFNFGAGLDGWTGYVGAVAVFGIFSVAANLFFAWSVNKKLDYEKTQELDIEKQYTEAEAARAADKPDGEKLTTLEMIKFLFTDIPLVAVIVTEAARYIGRASMLGILAYYFKYVIEDPTGQGFFLGFSSIVALIGAIATEFVAQKFKSKAIYLMGFCTMLVCYILMYFFGTTTMSFTVIGCVWFFGLALVNSSEVGLKANAVDYGVWKAKKNCRAWLMSAIWFAPKTGNLGRALVSGFGLVAIGFSATAPITPEVIEGIRMLTCLLPASIFVIGLLFLVFGYRIKEDQMDKIKKDLVDWDLVN